MFEFSDHGTREGIIKGLRAKQLPKPEDPKLLPAHEKQAAQAEEFKEFVVTEINELGTEFNGCKVTCNCSFNAGSRSAQLTVIGLKLLI